MNNPNRQALSAPRPLTLSIQRPSTINVDFRGRQDVAVIVGVGKSPIL